MLAGRLKMSSLTCQESETLPLLIVMELDQALGQDISHLGAQILEIFTLSACTWTFGLPTPERVILAK